METIKLGSFDMETIKLGYFECPKCGATCLVLKNKESINETYIEHGKSSWDPKCILMKEIEPAEYLLNLG